MRLGRFYIRLLEAGIYLAPSQFEADFVSLAHDATAIEQTMAAADAAFATLSD